MSTYQQSTGLQITNRTQPTSEFVLIDPATGNPLGTAAAPLVTGTNSLSTGADLTKSIFTITTATTTTLITATAAVRGRAYRLRIDVAAANVLTITDSTGAEKMNFPAAGFRYLDLSRAGPWYVTAVNTALTLTTTTTGEVNITVEWAKAA